MLPDYSALAHYCLRMHKRWSQSSCLQKECAVHVHALIPEQRIHMDASFMPRFLLFTRTGRSRRIMSRITARSLSLSRTSTKFLPVRFAYVISEAEGVIGERVFLFSPLHVFFYPSLPPVTIKPLSSLCSAAGAQCFTLCSGNGRKCRYSASMRLKLHLNGKLGWLHLAWRPTSL